MKNVATQDVIDEIRDMHGGLQMAMDNLIRAKNYTEAERVLVILDQRMSELLRTLKPAR